MVHAELFASSKCAKRDAVHKRRVSAAATWRWKRCDGCKKTRPRGVPNADGLFPIQKSPHPVSFSTIFSRNFLGESFKTFMSNLDRMLSDRQQS